MPDNMNDYKQVIILRKDLSIRKGKMISQGAHASLAAILKDKIIEDHVDGKMSLRIMLTEPLKAWLLGIFKKIVVSVDSEQELLEIEKKAREEGIITSLIQDSGLTEFGGVPTYTAVAIGPDSSDKLDPITGHLKLL